MSKEFPQFSEDETDKPQASAKPKRPAKTSGRKPAADKRSKSRESSGNPEVLKAPVAEAKVAAVVEKPVAKPTAEIETIWEDATPESVGGAASGGEGGSKRKRRRRKGKGGGSSSSTQGEGAEAVVSAAPTNPPMSQSPQTSKARMERIDPDTLVKAAWKIYLAEVCEEGVALVGDLDARELARRCFRLAEIFLEERGRHG